jgi:two-component system, sensor histidine kinase YesM
MVERLKTLINQIYKQKILSQKAELKQLQSQINPHFLYNSFFILSRMIKLGQYENSSDFASQLGGYFKYITRSASDEIELQKEVEHARVYTNIQEIRFSRRIRVIFQDLPDCWNDIIVSRLIIQPVIENAFEHGLENKKKDGIIQVTFNSIDRGIQISVEDNGEELTGNELANLQQMIAELDDTTEYTGILNIHRRITLKFGEESGMVLSKSTLGGLRVDINIMIQKENEHV